MNPLKIVLLLCILSSCTTNPEISIQVDPDQLVLENKKIDKTDFEKELKEVLSRKLNDGLEKEEIIIALKVHKNTRRGDLSDIEGSLRRLNVKRIRYLTYP